MKIAHLRPGTKLMWDAESSLATGGRYQYPALVGEKHWERPWVKIITAGNKSWMGPEEENLRLPTEQELLTLTWPEFPQ